MQGVHDVEVERLANRSGFFRAIENGDLSNAGGEGFHERLHAEGAIQANFQQSDFLAASGEIFDRFVRGFRAGAHHDDDALGIGSADVIEQVIGAADDLGELVHRRLHFGRCGVVVGIGAFANLEEDVGILRRAAQHRMIRRERALAVLDDAVHVEHGAHVVFIQHFDLVDFVRGAEAVEEMQEGNAGLERGGVRDQRQVHGFLHGVRAEHGPSRGAAEHHVGVVAKNRERVRGQSARGYVKHGRGQFAGNLVHVGDHQQQSLRRGKRGRERSGLQGAVHGSGGAAFTLHFDDVGHAAPGVGHALRRPLVRPLAHRRRRSDRVNGDHFARAIRDIGDGFVGVHGLEFALHLHPPFEKSTGDHRGGPTTFTGCRKGGVDVGTQVHRRV